MPTEAATTRRNKHFMLDQARLKRAQKILGAATETETIETALERVITDAERNRKAWAAHDRLIKAATKHTSTVEDVFGRLRKV